MIDQIKWYLVNLGMKKYLPLGIMAAIASLGALMAAHAGMLEQWGITYGNWPINFGTAPSGPCVVVEIDTLSKAAIAGIASLATMAFAAVQHHVTGNGTAVAGGRRDNDPPAKS